MGFEINVFDKKVLNQFTNGTTYNQNTAVFDETFTGNPEKLRVQADYEYTWFAASDPFSWNVQTGVIESTSQAFDIEGFEAGQIFEFYNDWSNRFADSPEFTAQITSISSGGTIITFSILSGSQTTIGNTVSNVGIWADAANENNLMPSVFVSFGLPLQTESDNFNSKLDSSLQRYNIASLLPSGQQNMLPSTPTLGQYTGNMSIEPIAATGKNAQRLQIKHDLIVNPYWLATDTPDVLNNPPSDDVKNIVSVDNVRFAGSDCLRYVQEIELRSNFTNNRGRKKRIQFAGNTGWFQDNFNSGSKNFELHEGSVIFNGGASTKLIFGQVNTLQFDIKASDGSDIPANSPFGVYFSLLPPESRYQNTASTFEKNFSFDSAVLAEGAGPINGENGFWQTVSGALTTVASQEMIRVTASLDLSGSTAQFDDCWIIWAGCESPNADISAVSCNQVARAGGAGVTDLNISLDASGGLMIFDVDMYSQVDKCEFIHNGVKVATTSMVSVNNGGVFDAANDASNYPNLAWYIGNNNGVIPTFYNDFEIATGITTLPFTSGYQQRLWWSYTPADYAADPTMIVRVTGTDGTAWEIKRICQ